LCHARDYNFFILIFSMNADHLNSIYPVSRSVAGNSLWDAAVAAAGANAGPDALFGALRAAADTLPGFLHDFLRLEHRFWLLKGRAADIPASVDNLNVNPTVAIEEVRWRGLSILLEPGAGRTADPVEGPEHLLLWFDPQSKHARIKPVANDDLLALKMVAEGITPEAVAAEGGIAIGNLDNLIDRAVRQGLLLAPASRLRRDPSVFTARQKSDEEFLVSDSFTLQWHITQVCDLHCKHCYDRTDRSPLAFEQAVRVLDDLRSFCRERSARCAISFTGGNPLLHPRFLDIYRAAVERGFGTAILGNPAPRARIE
jgi:selenobiotic family peptide radical SAM maturase